MKILKSLKNDKRTILNTFDVIRRELRHTNINYNEVMDKITSEL